MNRLKISLLALLVCWLLPAACHAEQYALLIGLDRYPKRAYNLNSCIADLHGVADALQSHCGYKPENIQLLVGEGKTKVKRQEILDTVKAFAARIHPDDTVFFFWSGHGTYLEGQDRVQPYDVDNRSLDAYRRTTLPVQEMLAPLLRVRSKALLLFFNMCRGDATAQFDFLSAAGPVAVPTQPVLPATTGPQQKVSFYSSVEGQLSMMWADKRRSYFGYYLEQGLRGEAADAQGEIHVENLVNYVQKAVPGKCWRQGAPLQKPYVVVSGPEALRLLLASGLTPGQGGATAVPTVVGASADDRFDAAFQAATEAWSQQHYEEARARFEEAANLKPAETQAVVALADADKQLQRWEDAERCYQQALKAWPKDGALFTSMAEISYSRKDYGEAEKRYRQAIAISPKMGQPVCELANLYADVKHEDATATGLYIRAIQLDPTDPNALNGLGNIFLRQKNYPEAENIYRKLMAVHPDYAVAVGNLAYLMYTAKKDIPEAERLYQQAIALDPTSGWLQNGLGWLYYNSKKEYDKAEKCFRKAIELDPDDIQPIINMAAMEYDRKNPSASEAFYLKALEHDPRNVAALCQIGTIRFDRGDYAEAEKRYRQTLEIDPKHALATDGLANLCCAHEQYAEAEKLYHQAMEFDATEGLFHANLAICLLKEKQKDAAVTEAKKALELGYKDSWVFSDLGLTTK